MKHKPKHVSPPGDTLRAHLERRDISIERLAEDIDHPQDAIQSILSGEAIMDEGFAQKLEDYLNVPVAVWLHLEETYRQSRTQLLCQKFPWKKMVQAGFVQKCIDLEGKIGALQDFFQVDSLLEYQTSVPDVLFKETKQTDHEKIAESVWLRRGLMLVEETVNTPAYDQSTFLEKLTVIRDHIQSTYHDPKIKIDELLITTCMEAGVQVILVPSLPQTSLHGATYWRHERPIIQLNLGIKKSHILWSNFFHIAAHILLHARDEHFFERDDDGVRDERELEADLWAQDMLMPKTSWTQFANNHNQFYPHVVARFSRAINISPDIVAARLCKEDRSENKYFKSLWRPRRWRS